MDSPDRDRLTPSRNADNLTDVMDTNVTGTHRVTQAFLPLLRRGTRKTIVNMCVTA